MGFDVTTTPFSNSQLQEALDRAEAEIKKRTSTVFVDGTAATPAWIQITEEKHTGKGTCDKRYFLEKYPIPNVSTTVNGTAVGTADTTIYVTSTNGFPSSGYISIESDKIVYTGKTTTTFTGCSGQESTHGTAKTVKPYVIEISTTAEGQATEWTVMEHDKDYDIDLNTGRVALNESSLESNASNTVAFSRYPQYQIPNRFRATYIAGVDNIPDDIARAELMIAARDLMHTAVRKAHALGKNSFNPELVDIDKDWIDSTINSYKKHKTQLI